MALSGGSSHFLQLPSSPMAAPGSMDVFPRGRWCRLGKELGAFALIPEKPLPLLAGAFALLNCQSNKQRKLNYFDLVKYQHE
ncbi:MULTISPECIES: hypothetical protein [Hymenobacter]|uniref:Uncharacterized protein n=1 Tax=Hymenobacter latericoloratus TaxID=1411121 RepID=A0ABR6K1R6_9BACT|nr:hypothetical protein [Hymenobacter latericoloratus]MBB4603024.1 hypothetical protein [Hymenobacter latericoloratus]